VSKHANFSLGLAVAGDLPQAIGAGFSFPIPCLPLSFTYSTFAFYIFLHFICVLGTFVHTLLLVASLLLVLFCISRSFAAAFYLYPGLLFAYPPDATLPLPLSHSSTMRSAVSVAAASLLGQVAAQAILGFNSGASLNTGAAKAKADFEKEFTAAANLAGAPGSLSSVRLYTNIQAGTTNTPSAAFQAAIDTNTTMLLGIWCSGTTTIANELAALTSAISTYGSDFASLVVGISIGSEDLYRDSVTGIANKAGVGNTPAALVGFIKDTRAAVANTALSSVPIGHVDTYDVWGNSSIASVVDAIDFLGTDAYPYFETSKGNNSIDNAKTFFDRDFNAAKAASGGKPVWITETGWPTSGPNSGDAVPSVANAQQYWDQVGCELFGKTNTWWYTIYDSNAADSATFAITDNFSTTPKYNLTCPAVSSSSSSSSASSSATGSASGSASGSTSGSASQTAGSGSATKTSTGTVASVSNDSLPSGTSTPATGAAAINGASGYITAMVMGAAVAYVMV
jgi:glucan endo-1,3-beta-D-glucosidase